MPSFRSEDNRLREFKNTLRGARLPAAALGAQRLSAPPEIYSRVIEFLETRAPKGKKLLAPAYPASPDLLQRQLPFDGMPLDREYQWAAARLQNHATVLNRFVVIADRISESIGRSKFQAALDSLDAIKKEFGYSLWYLKMQMVLTQKTRGFEAQKRAVAGLLKWPHLDPLVSYLIQFVSIRNEITMSPRSFKSILQKHSLTDEIKGLTAYAKYHLYPVDIIPTENIAQILRWEESSSLIDLYQAFIRVSESHLSDHRLNDVSPVVRNTLSLLTRSLEDPRLSILDRSKKSFCLEKMRPEWKRVTLDFEQGEYGTAQQLAEDLLEKGPLLWEGIELVGRSAAMNGVRLPSSDVVLWRSMAAGVQSVLAEGPDGNDAFDEFLRIALNYDGLPWSGAILNFLEREFSSSRGQASNGTSSAFSPCLLKIFNPLTFLAVEGASLLESHGPDPCLPKGLEGSKLPKHSADTKSLSSDSVFCLEAAAALSQGDWTTALEASTRLQSAQIPHFQRQGIRIRVAGLLATRRYHEAVQYVTGAYLADGRALYVLQVDRLCHSLDRALAKQLSFDISAPILFDIYSRHFGSSKDKLRRLCFLDFLRAAQVSLPSELGSRPDLYLKDALVYFLRHLCSIALLQKISNLDSTRGVRDERIKICQFLAELDPNNLDDYQLEIKEITTTQAVQSGLRQVEQSKIHVDVEGIREVSRKNLRENFNRYQSLSTERIQQITKEIVAALSREEDGRPRIHAFALPKDERPVIFTSMVVSLRDEFVFNTQYGLNFYLSLRIRHGTLQGHLRGTLEGANILTQQEADSPHYRPNEYWVNIIAGLESREQHAISERLATFSEHFDTLIQNIRTEWIQVRVKEEESGLFDFILRETDFQAIELTLTSEAFLEEFVDLVIGYLWKQLERSLAAIRQSILNRAKDDFDSLLTSLERDITSCLGDRDDCGLIAAIVTGRTDIYRALDRMAGWFNLPSQTGTMPVLLSLASRVAAETVERFHRGVRFQPSTVIGIDPLYSRERWVRFVDIFLILFENIVTHCGTATRHLVDIGFKDHGDTVFIRVENYVPEQARTREVIERVSRIREQMDRGESSKFVSKEGHSGLHKIHKQLDESGTLSKSWFGFEGDKFYVEFHVRKEMSSDENIDG